MNTDKPIAEDTTVESVEVEGDSKETQQQESDKEIGGRNGPEPTRFGDWEIKGRCVDF